jgi:hypothetical protein
VTLSKIVTIPKEFEVEWELFQQKIIAQGGIVRDAFGPMSFQPQPNDSGIRVSNCEFAFENKSVDYSPGLAPHETKLKSMIAESVKKHLEDK